MAATSADSLAHVDASHSPTKPKDIEYPVSSKSKPDKEKHKADLLKANTETLYADLNRNKEITNLIFLTNSPEAWLNAIQEHYPDIKKDGRKENPERQKYLRRRRGQATTRKHIKKNGE